MVEGHRRFALPWPDLHHALLANLDDARHEWLQILHDRRRGNAQGRNMLRPQKIRPRFIALCRSGSVMCSPIDLNSEMHGSAVEIENIDTRWVLSPIFEPAGALPKPAPEHRFWQVHFASQLAGVFECIAGAGG